MDKKLREEKLKMWKDNLAKLEKDLQETMQKRGQAAEEGDLSENAAYTMASEDSDTCRVQIDQVKKIIADLENK